MEEQNPYRSPDTVVVDAPVDDADLAGRGERLWAALADTAILLAINLPLMVMGGYWHAVMSAAAEGQRVAIGTQAMWMLIGFAVFVVVQGIPLNASGQTWGKKVLKIKIVDMSGTKPSLGWLLGMRYLPIQAIGGIPLVGGLAALVDILLIFRDDRRCGHDLIAGTKVVKAE